jgi:hypothetical protein
MKVLAVGTLKPFSKEQSDRIFPNEVPATLQLYLSGKIEQFWPRDELKGAVFLRNVESVAEAENCLERFLSPRRTCIHSIYCPSGRYSRWAF